MLFYCDYHITFIMFGNIYACRFVRCRATNGMIVGGLKYVVAGRESEVIGDQVASVVL